MKLIKYLNCQEPVKGFIVKHSVRQNETVS